jgi:hypothetical protein
VRLLLLLLLAGVGAYFTVPAREAHETALRAFLDARAEEEGLTVTADMTAPGFSLDNIVDFAVGVVAGQGRYENYLLASKFTVDAPGAAYVECWGAFTFVQCRQVDRASGQS